MKFVAHFFPECAEFVAHFFPECAKFIAHRQHEFTKLAPIGINGSDPDPSPDKKSPSSYNRYGY